MKRSLTVRLGGLALCAALAAGCSGGGSGPIAAPVGGVSQAKSKQKSTVALFIPRSATAAAAAKDRRSPAYVSYSTAGLVITTSQTVDGTTTPIDSVSFATGAGSDGTSKDGNAYSCVATPAQGMTPAGTTCTFSVGVLAPSTNFTISAYDAPPNADGTDSGNLLSTFSGTVTITPGASNNVSLTLGGVAASLAFTESTTLAGGAPSASAPVSSGAVFSAPGQGSASTFAFSYVTKDAAGNTIMTSDTLANAASVTVAETNGGNSAYTTVTPTSTTAGSGSFTVTYGGGGFPTSASASPTSAPTSLKTLAVAATPASAAGPYSAGITFSLPESTDPSTGMPAQGAKSATFTIAPLFLTATIPSANTNDRFTVTAAGHPTLSYADEGSNDTTSMGSTSTSTAPHTEVGLLQAFAPTVGTVAYASSVAACTTDAGPQDFAFPTGTAFGMTTAAYDASYTDASPPSGETCTGVTFTDGISTLTLTADAVSSTGSGTIVIPSSPAPAISFSPASGTVKLYCDPTRDSTSVNCSATSDTPMTASGGTAPYSIVSPQPCVDTFTNPAGTNVNCQYGASDPSNQKAYYECNATSTYIAQMEALTAASGFGSPGSAQFTLQASNQGDASTAGTTTMCTVEIQDSSTPPLTANYEFEVDYTANPAPPASRKRI